MKDYYRAYNLKIKSSTSRITRTLEGVIRAKLNNESDIKEALTALRILTSAYLRKIYNLKLGKKKISPGARAVLEAEPLKTEHLIEGLDLVEIFDEKNFLRFNYARIILRSLGLDFFVSSIGFQTSKGQKPRSLGRDSGESMFLMHTVLYYGIPILLGLIDPLLWLTIVPVFLIRVKMEYREAKMEYYAENLEIKMD